MQSNFAKMMQGSLSDIVQSELSDYSNNQSVQVDNDAYIHQNAHMNLANATLFNCTIQLDQVAGSQLLNMANIDQSSHSDMHKNMSNKLSETMAATLDQINKGLQIGLSSNHAEIKQQMDSFMQQKLSTIVKNAISSVVSTTNTQHLEVDVEAPHLTCYFSDIIVNQKSAMKLVSDNIVKSTLNNVLDVKAVQEADKKIEAKLKQANEGIDLMGLLVVVVVILMMLGQEGGGGGIFTIIMIVGLIVLVVYSRSRR